MWISKKRFNALRDRVEELTTTVHGLRIDLRRETRVLNEKVGVLADIHGGKLEEDVVIGPFGSARRYQLVKDETKRTVISNHKGVK